MDTKQLDNLLKPVIDKLKGIEPFIYADNENLFYEMGWDVCEGEGDIIAQCEINLDHYLQTLPTVLKNWLWFQSDDGQFEIKWIEKTLNAANFDGDFEAVMEDHEFKLTSVVRKFLMSRLMELAEDAYCNQVC